MTKKWHYLFFALVMTGLLVACSSSDSASETDRDSSNKVELRMLWWGSQDRHDRTLEVIDLYMEENPNVTISAEFTGWDGYWEKMATQAAGGNLPDIVQMDYKYLAEYAGKGLLADLNPYLESDALDLSDVEDTYIDGGIIDDKLYAVNIGANAHAIVVDNAMFEEAGIDPLEPGYTWEELKEKAKALSDNLGDNVYGVHPGAGVMGFKHYLRQHDQWLYSEDGTELGYDDDQLLVDYLQITVDMLESGAAAPPDVFMTAGTNVEQFPIVNEETAIVMDIHSNQITAIESGAGRSLDLMLQPSLEGGELGHYIKPGQFFSVAESSEQQEEAAKFISFFTNSIEANEILNAERGVPIAGAVREHLKENASDAGRKMFEYVELAQEHSREIDPPDPQGSTEIESLFANEVQDPIYYGEVTPEEAAENFRAKASEILATDQ
ncbi:carbohydrate ABC transporter substrate-binding protein, CUT1 family [Gracilibacillus orientalis]|uniref:Carbohydrate ABC transporter substrate-binding protein, CUT1 family n=1 Tax=Gracilibacillus orientalis TaxID=334253 RepID=A0A1I4LJ84_9BACI|nr:sugar ABC transporter substrate-binding protein [Gracilibacillus orientalis]SFL90896.1 carbohydrate ABC transporter substrate-binding protein, CUT1 family [Gracilibacillus orientalis]